MEATNKRRENLTWPDEGKTRKQLEAIRELAKELRTDYPTDTPDEPTNWSNEARNRRNAYIRAQFLTDESGFTFHLLTGSEWLELFDLLGFSVDKETRKRFASHLNWYSFWYADFKPRLSSKYAQRIHWYVHNFLFCLRNKLQTEKDYREGKYGSKGQAYFMEIEEQPAQPTETPRISTETAETVNVSAEGEKEAERAEMESYNVEYYVRRFGTVANLDKEYETAMNAVRCEKDEYDFNRRKGGKFRTERIAELNRKLEALGLEWMQIRRAMNGYFKEHDTTSTEPPQSPETPPTVEHTADTPKPRETARKPQNRGIGNTRATRRDTLRNTLRSVTYVPRICSTANAPPYW